jgi:hypothetical protein
MKKRFVFSPKAIYTYEEIEKELKRIVEKLSVEEKLDMIKQHHTS